MTYILVEAGEDKIFLSYLLINVLNKKDFHIDFNGSHGITDYRITDIINYIDNGYNIIIINDADKNFLSRKQEIINKINNHDIKADIFLFPNNKDNGILEDLLLNCIPKEQKCVPQCFDSFLECLQTLSDNGHKIALPAIKSKIYTYVEVQRFKEDKYNREEDGSYFYRKSELWDFNCDAIKPLLQFLKDNVK